MRHFTKSIAIAILVISGCAPPSNEPTTSAGSSSSAETSQSDAQLQGEPTSQAQINDIGIAVLPTPEGWKPNRSNGNTAVIFLRKNGSVESPEEMISIDLGKPIASTARESAQGIAAKFGGTVTEFADGLDGEPTFRVSVPANYEQLMPRECLVAHHGDKVCFIFGGSKSQADIWPALLEIAGSWKWN